RCVARQDAEVPLLTRNLDFIDVLVHDRARGRDELEPQMFGKRHLLLLLFGLLERFLDRADQIERLLRNLVVLALDDFPEALDGVGDRDVLALEARELLRDEKRLRQESLDLAR